MASGERVPFKGHPQRTRNSQPSTDTERRWRTQPDADREIHAEILTGAYRYSQIPVDLGTHKQTDADSP